MFLVTYIVIILVMPNFLGLTLSSYKKDEILKFQDLLDNFLRGFFLMLAIFELLCVPMAALRISLTTLSLVFSAITLLLSAWSFYRFRSMMGSLCHSITPFLL